MCAANGCHEPGYKNVRLMLLAKERHRYTQPPALEEIRTENIRGQKTVKKIFQPYSTTNRMLK
jgi:hypothetical protein